VEAEHDEAESLPLAPYRLRRPVTTPQPRLTNSVLAHRYLVIAPLGVGGHGQVWLAHDQLLHEDVAVKLLPTVTPQQRVRVRREIAMLRRLQVPGVVPLRDEGVHGPRTFLVMDVVDGCPFPDKRHTWPELAPTTVALLETLARIHAVGVVHRDLKPGNVLVTADGRPILLDFGISWDELDGTLTRTGQILGTPAYLAPEQIDGAAVSPRTDLYALGVMLYEALSGEHPYGITDPQAIVYARALGPPMPLGRRMPGLPKAVGAVVDALLRPDPSDRPRSAYDVLTLLRGEPAALAVTRGPLPWLDTPALDPLLQHVEAGRSVALLGPPGVGRTSVLRRLASTLMDRGGKVLWATASTRPFGSLESLVGSLDTLHHHTLAEAFAVVRDDLRGLLADGAVLLVDDSTELDLPSTRVIAASLDAGAVVRVLSEPPGPGDPSVVVTLQPFDEIALRSLIAGPSRLFHLPEDTAEALFARTDGVVARVAEELHAWVRAGLVRWQGERVVVDAVGLAALRDRAGPFRLASLRPRSARKAPGVFDAMAAPLLRWIQLAWPQATVSLLQKVSGEPRWRLEAILTTLVQEGSLRQTPDGAYALSAEAPVESLRVRHRTEAHFVLAAALPVGVPGRLQHLLAGAPNPWPLGFAEAVRQETEARVATLVEHGGLREALGVLGESLGALRSVHDDPESSPEVLDETRPAEHGLLGRLVELSLVDCTTPVLDRALFALSRAMHPDATLEALRDLVLAARALREAGNEVLARVEALPGFADPGLERRRLNLRVLAHNQTSVAQEAAVVADAVAIAERLGDPESLALAHLWRARVSFRASEFVDAARICEEAPQATWATTRIELLVYAASAWMEAFSFSHSARLAQQARDSAAEIRHPYLQARAERVLRAVAYRTGAALAPDLELLDAAAHLQSDSVEALLLGTEAAIAWRAHNSALAYTLAAKAHGLWTKINWALGRLICGTLMHVATPEADETVWQHLVDRALDRMPQRSAAECLGLLGALRPLPQHARTALTDWAHTIPREHWAHRMEVLTVEEILDSSCQSLVSTPV